MTKSKTTFPDIFRRLRLKAQIDSLRELCGLLADAGYIVEESTISRWQGGTRVPKNRRLIIALIKIFALREAITTTESANELLLLANLVPLSETEEKELALKNNKHIVFSLPPQQDIIGVDNILIRVRSVINSQNGHLRVILHGLPGTGKSSTAIYIAHQIQSHFDRGIIWVRVLNRTIAEVQSALVDILSAHLPEETDKVNLMQLIRTRQFLIIFDNVESSQTLTEITDYFFASSYVVTTTHPATSNHSYTIEITPFNEMDAYEVFSRSAGRSLTEKEKELVKKISNQVGNLPLPLAIIANTLRSRLAEDSLGHILGLIKEKEAGLAFFQDNFAHIIGAFEALFDQLTDSEKRVLRAVATKRSPIFHTSDISVSSLSASAVQWVLFTLGNKSLLDRTGEGVYRIHPLLYRFLRIKAASP